ncbi:TatD family hydrolase [Hutsoniella sourekii]
MDSHYHFDFLPKDRLFRLNFLQDLYQDQIGVIAQTVLPSTYQELIQEVEYYQGHGVSNVRPSLGFHPWWMESADQVEAELDVFARAVIGASMIGEIGLDFAPRILERVDASQQIAAFKRIVELLVNDQSLSQARILSIHCVRSADAVLEVLEASDIQRYDIIPILHRFNGTSDQVSRLIRLGGYLSVHPDMLQTKKGRAYVCQVPKQRLLLESDLPSQSLAEASQVTEGELAHALSSSLLSSLSSLTALRGEAMQGTIEANQALLYGYFDKEEWSNEDEY